MSNLTPMATGLTQLKPLGLNVRKFVKKHARADWPKRGACAARWRPGGGTATFRNPLLCPINRHSVLHAWPCLARKKFQAPRE